MEYQKNKKQKIYSDDFRMFDLAHALVGSARTVGGDLILCLPSMASMHAIFFRQAATVRFFYPLAFFPIRSFVVVIPSGYSDT